MILEKYVEIKLNSTTIKYWLDKGYVLTTHVDSKGRVKQFRKGTTRLVVKVEDLPPKSNVLITAKCMKCSKNRKIQFGQYTDICWSCNLQNQKGVNHPRYLQQVKDNGHDRGFDLYLRRKYGITSEQYYAMFKKQNYCCAICNRPQSEEGRKFAVDHKHGTKIVRGILCQPCNTAIGLMKEDAKTLNTAVKYLQKAA